MPCPLAYDDTTYFAWNGTTGTSVTVSLVSNSTALASASYNGIVLPVTDGKSTNFKLVQDFAELRLYFAGPSNPGGDSIEIIQDCGGTTGMLHDDDNSLAYSITFLLHGSAAPTAVAAPAPAVPAIGGGK